MVRPRVVVISNDLMQSGFDLLSTKCEVLRCPVEVLTEEERLAGYPGPPQTREDVIQLLRNSSPVDGILWSNKVRCDKEMLDIAGPDLKVVVTMSAGFDHLDLVEMKQRGIQVGRSCGALDAAVAEIGVMLALSAGRRAHEGRLKITQDRWESRPRWMLGHGLRGSTVGIVGLGGIGQAILKRLANFEVSRFLYTGHSAKKTEFATKFVTLDHLLRESDFVFVSCPLTDETRRMFNAETFKKMKQTAVLVNVARGALIDQPSLVRALREGVIFAAGLDVTDPEPLPSDNELLYLPNAVVTPHMGSCTIKARSDLSELAARSLLLALSGETMPHPL